MKPKLIAVLVVLSAVVGIGAGYLVKRLNDDTAPPPSSGQEPTPAEEPTKDPTKDPAEDPAEDPTEDPTTDPPSDPTTDPTEAEDDSEESPQVPPLVAKNRDERRGPSWSPADLTGPDGEPLELGNISPGTFGMVRVGDNVDKYVDAGYLAADIEKESACEGTYWKWAGQLNEGLDVIADQTGAIGSLGMTRDGLETAEGISIGNSLRALRDTYGKELTAPHANDYGQAAVFLPGNGDGWLGFGFNATPEELGPNSRITFIEASKGHRPGMLRDGC
ncbi:hypothetical protein [Nocardioides speluncae]|uniref:hypothetical protein n=1 Tax=Nocardioides speluncae TaxID=2670337 RepID=UPI000D68E52C|nr:hypothetical protein [Nocardioides speluncae]